MTYYLGIDLGKHGGIVALNHNGLFHSAHVMPILGDRIDPATLFKLLANYKHFHPIAYLEKVHAMPKLGVTASFSFGVAAGYCEMALAGNEIQYTMVTPQNWQKVMFEGIEKKLKPKQKAAIAAARLNGVEYLMASERSKKPHEGLVDAFLLARFAFIKHGGSRDSVA